MVHTFADESSDVMEHEIDVCGENRNLIVKYSFPYFLEIAMELERFAPLLPYPTNLKRLLWLDVSLLLKRLPWGKEQSFTVTESSCDGFSNVQTSPRYVPSAGDGWPPLQLQPPFDEDLIKDLLTYLHRRMGTQMQNFILRDEPRSKIKDMEEELFLWITFLFWHRPV